MRRRSLLPFGFLVLINGAAIAVGCSDNDVAIVGTPAPTASETTTAPPGTSPTGTTTSTGTSTGTEQPPPPPPPTFAIAGTINDLEGDGLVLGSNGQTLDVSTAGAFAFPTRVANGTAFDVQIQTQPISPSQNCVVASGSPGTIAGADSAIVIGCSRIPFLIGGTIVGLGDGGSVTLQDRGGDDLIVTTNGAFTFPSKVPSGAPYNVTIASATPGAKCSVEAGTGTVGNADVSSVVVNCTVDKHVIGGTVSGLIDKVVLQNGGDTVTATSNGSFAFPIPLPTGSSYAVTIARQPAGQTCAVTSGTGTVGAGSVTNVRVVCEGRAKHTVHVDVSGLDASTSGLTIHNGAASLVATSNGTYDFGLQSDGTPYNVTFDAPAFPPQTCKISGDTSGSLAGEDVTAKIACDAPSIGPFSAAAGWSFGVPAYDGMINVGAPPNNTPYVCTESQGLARLVAGTWGLTNGTQADPDPNAAANTNISTPQLLSLSTQDNFNIVLVGAQGITGQLNLFRGSGTSWPRAGGGSQAITLAGNSKPATMYGTRVQSGMGNLFTSWDEVSGTAVALTSQTDASGVAVTSSQPGSPYKLYPIGAGITGTPRSVTNVSKSGTQDFVVVYGKTPSGADAKGGVFAGSNAGKTWTAKPGTGAGAIDAADLDRLWTVRGIFGTKTLYVGVRGGAQAYRSTDGGDTWTKVNAGLPAKAEVLSLFVATIGGVETAYAGTNLGLFKLTGGTGAWSYVGFAGKSVHAVLVDTNTNALLVGVDDSVGLYQAN